MESKQETIDSNYIIVEKKGKGASANVYLVKDKNNSTVYAAKVLKEPSPHFQQEIDILNILKTTNNPYIINIINSGEGLVIRKDHPEQISQYLILEYASKGDLFNYIYCANKGLGERLSKLYFSQILRSVQACHNVGICHRDLKLQNILCDDNFSPKICDFGFATQNNDHLTEYLGTTQYAAPEVLGNIPYDGFKADIFSLGVILINLTIGKIGFFEATKKDGLYCYIMAKRIKRYWAKIENKIPPVSEEFKDLFIKMVAFDPNERPTIEEILKGDWMKEIRELKEEQIKLLENEIREEFLKREDVVKEYLVKEMEVEKDSNESSGNRGANDETEYFDLSLQPKYAQTGLNMKNYIKLKGELNPVKFMNSLANKIQKEFDDCFIDPIKGKLKFNVKFEEEETEEEIPKDILEEIEKMGIKDNEEKDENENIKKNNTEIQIKIYKSYNGGHLLRFVKKGGDPKQYLEKMQKITTFIKAK